MTEPSKNIVIVGGGFDGSARRKSPSVGPSPAIQRAPAHCSHSPKTESTDLRGGREPVSGQSLGVNTSGTLFERDATEDEALRKATECLHH
jgi:hypothetical protein